MMHTLFCGPEGSGKRTRALDLIPEDKRISVELEKFECGISLNIEYSKYHVGLNARDAGRKDKQVIKELYRDLTKSKHRTTKSILIYDAHYLSSNAQASMRVLMEEYGYVRVIFITSNASRLIDPIKSRCKTIRVPAPTEEHVRKLYGPKVPAGERNLNRAQIYAKGGFQPKWETFIDQMVTDLSRETIQTIRKRVYLLERCGISSSRIISRIYDTALKDCKTDQEKLALLQIASLYEVRSHAQENGEIHVEAFIVHLYHLRHK